MANSLLNHFSYENFFTQLIDSMKLPLGLLYHSVKNKINEMHSTVSNYSTSSSFLKYFFFVLAWLFQPKAWLTFQQTYNVFFEKSKLIFWIVQFNSRFVTNGSKIADVKYLDKTSLYQYFSFCQMLHLMFVEIGFAYKHLFWILQMIRLLIFCHLVYSAFFKNIICWPD